MPTVLVTGGMGFIGSWVTRKLVEEGVKPVLYSRHTDDTFLKDILTKVKITHGDILDFPNLVSVIKRHKVKRIIHMAATLITEAQSNPRRAFQVNVEGTINILEAAKLMDVERVVYTSSKSIYDIVCGEYAHPTYKPISEDYPARPTEVYGATKLFCEHMGLNYKRVYGFDFVALRFAASYGPGKMAQDPGLAITSWIIENAVLGKPVKIVQGGEQKEDLIYVKDLADGIVMACFAKNLQHSVFHFGTGKGTTLKDLARVLKDLSPKASIEIGPGLNYKGTDKPRYCIFDISRARKELGFGPKYTLEDGVRDYLKTMHDFNVRLEASSYPVER